MHTTHTKPELTTQRCFRMKSRPPVTMIVSPTFIYNKDVGRVSTSQLPGPALACSWWCQSHLWTQAHTHSLGDGTAWPPPPFNQHLLQTHNVPYARLHTNPPARADTDYLMYIYSVPDMICFFTYLFEPRCRVGTMNHPNRHMKLST